MAGTSSHLEMGHRWPALPLDAWQDTYATLHMYSQVVGKIRLELAPLQNHWWNVALYLTPRGLTTSAIPYRGGAFALDFDLIEHDLLVRKSDGETRALPLRPRPVAEFYGETMALLRSIGIEVTINTTPCEVPNPIPFERDRQHAAYDPQYATRFLQILLRIGEVFGRFRSDFIGKCSPVHFFWGSFDLAVTRFSGRNAPERAGADAITREASSHEVSSVGFWPGAGIEGPAFYSYTSPEPVGFSETVIRPRGAFYDGQLHEFLLMYDDVREAADPGATLMEFCRSTYEAGAGLGGWDRAALERAPSAQP